MTQLPDSSQASTQTKPDSHQELNAALANFGPLRLLVLQPTSFCNLDCDYCYLPNRHQHNRLSLDLIRPIFQRIFTSPFARDHFTICWHAGEPLSVPVDYYRQAFEIIQATSDEFNHDGITFDISFQTNGILINPAWCQLFQDYPVHVGVSIDGPAFLHDAHRQTRTGLGSHQAVMRGIQCLHDHDIYPSVIAVLTADSLAYPDEMYEFFDQHQLRDVGFNMEETEGIHEHSSLDKTGMEHRYREFMGRFWELVTASQGTFRVREFESMCNLIYTNDRLTQTDMNAPFVILNVDYQGNFSTFDPELLSVKTDPYGDFILGNVLTDSLEAVCQTPKFQHIYRDMQAGVAQCRATCDYFGLCGGGAGSNKYWEKGTFNCTETLACRYRTQAIADLVIEKLETSLGLAPA